MEVVVGLDVGSRSVRGVALDRDGTVVCDAKAEYVGAETWPIGEAVPERWLDAVAFCLEDLRDRCPETAAPAALAVGGQSPTAIPVGGGRALTYQFTTGNEGGMPAQQKAQLEHLAADRPGADVCQLWDWVLHKLGAPRMQGRWPNDFSIDELGERVDTGSVVGESDGTFGIKAGTPLVPGAPDAILTFWAAGLDEPGRGCDPGGHTGGLVVATVDRQLPPGMMKMASPARGCVMVGGPVSAHGASLEWLSRVTSRPIEELLVLAASSPPGARGVMFLPYLEGERSPRWNRQLTGEFHGIRSDTDVADLARRARGSRVRPRAHLQDARRRRHSDRGGHLYGIAVTQPALVRDQGFDTGSPVRRVGVQRAFRIRCRARCGAGAGWWPRPSTAAAGSWPRPPMSRVEPAPRSVYEEGLGRFIALGDIAQERLTNT